MAEFENVLQEFLAKRRALACAGIFLRINLAAFRDFGELELRDWAACNNTVRETKLARLAREDEVGLEVLGSILGVQGIDWGVEYMTLSPIDGAAAQ
jgi:hypothetical protein